MGDTSFGATAKGGTFPPLGAWYGVTVTYHREPTKAEIAAGEGVAHYIEVPLWRAIKCRRKLLDRIQVDGVRYRR